MKHLKRFNESLDEVGLKDFCEETLAYLLDEGFIVDIGLDWRDLSGNTIPIPESRYIASVYTISLYNSTNGTSRNTFTWDDIKDYYIPFLQLLSRRYSLVTQASYQRRVNAVCVVSRLPGGLMRDYYSYDFVIKDGYEGFKNELADSELYEIKIQVHNQ